MAPVTTVLEGRWSWVKGLVVKQWDKLTFDDIESVNGNDDELISRLMNAYCLNRVEADTIFYYWAGTI